MFVQNLLGNTSVTGGTYWKQCSYNENHRDRFPGIDSTWDADNDRFSPPCPYPNWVFDSDNNKWKAPFECVISDEDAAEDGKYHRPEWNTSRNTWVCLNLADATTTIGEQEYSVLKHGLLIPDDWDGDKYYWDNDTDNWVKILMAKGYSKGRGGFVGTLVSQKFINADPASVYKRWSNNSSCSIRR